VILRSACAWYLARKPRREALSFELLRRRFRNSGCNLGAGSTLHTALRALTGVAVIRTTIASLLFYSIRAGARVLVLATSLALAPLAAVASDGAGAPVTGAQQGPAVAPVRDDGPSGAPVKGHVGPAVCAECHAKQSEAWKTSQHSRAMQVADAATVLGNFHNATYSYAGITSTFSMRAGKYFVRTDGPDGKLHDYEIRYTFGLSPLQQYLIAMPGGRLQALSIAWDARPQAQGGQRWFHLYPKENIKAGDPLHWTGIGQNWNFMCAECHSTDLRKRYDAAHDRFDTQWSDVAITCEACHGPGAKHVEWARAKRDAKPAARDNGPRTGPRRAPWRQLGCRCGFGNGAPQRRAQDVAGNRDVRALPCARQPPHR
jgi:hypothetical protein